MTHQDADELRLEPARSIIEAFGNGDITAGISVVSEITGRDRSRVLRWMYPKTKGGTDGAIPTGAIQTLFSEAKRRDLQLTADTFIGVAA